MPNWCENGATFLHEDPAMLERIRKGLQEQRLFQEFVPLEEGLKDGEYCGAAAEKWGTKWDASGHDIDERDGGVFLLFDTAWTPPIAFYEKLVEMGFSITAYYYEPGCAFCGIFTNANGDEYYPIEEANSEWVRENIPTDIDTFFGISDMMDDDEQYEEEQDQLLHSMKTVKLNEDGDAFIDFTDEEMNLVGWKEGDTIVWTNNGNGTYTLSKKENE